MLKYVCRCGVEVHPAEASIHQGHPWHAECLEASRLCDWCGSPIPTSSRSHRRTCSARCRQAQSRSRRAAE